MHFDEAVRYLHGLGHEVLAMKLGLRNTELLLESLRHPERSAPVVQIAGTNGKGSVTAILDSICRHAGIKTGRYTSPHLSSITERITIDGNDISPASFAAHATTVREAGEQLISTSVIETTPTFFEQLTAIALSAFREAAVDLIILETGLGGRLDSTTAANAQLVGITAVALDHEQYLGDTIAEIAREKAAIIRPGVRAVVGPQTPEALKTIMDRCKTVNVTPLYNECETLIEGVAGDGKFCVTFQTAANIYESVWLGLRGRHQIENTTIAIQLAEQLQHFGFSIPHQAITEGVCRASHPGRLELIPGCPPILLDGAHNAAGAVALRKYLEEFGPRPISLVFGCMSDKQVEHIANTLFSVADHLVLTPVNNPRATSVEKLTELANRLLPAEKIRVANSGKSAVEIARAQTPEGLVCITGSLYLIGEVRPLVLRDLSDTVIRS